MLRPSESPVVFLLQLGRGLRAAEGKEGLTVIDSVGKHRARQRAGMEARAAKRTRRRQKRLIEREN